MSVPERGVAAGSSGRVSLIAESLSERLENPPASILYLTRSELEPAGEVRRRFPGTVMTMLTKTDFQRKGVVEALRLLRRKRHDVFIFQDGTAAAARLADVYRLIALLSRAGRRFLLIADIARGGVEAGWRLEEVRKIQALPGLALRLLLEGLCVFPVLGFTSVRLALSPRRRPTARRVAPPGRIAYLRTEFAFGIRAGGSVSHISGVTDSLVELGYGVYFVSSDALHDIDPERTPVTVISPGRRIRVFEEAAMTAFHHRFVAEGTKVLGASPPDFIYQRHSVFNAAGAVLARRLGVPLILEANHSEVEARAMWSRLHLRGLAERMERFAFETADVVVAVSGIGAEELVRAGADRNRILVNPNGVDVSRFRPDIDGRALRLRLGFEPGHVVCGFIGTFTRWHGVLFLADCLPELVRRFPGVRFLFMGDGDLRSRVEAEAAESGVAAACVFSGLIPHDQVPEHLAACDVLLSPHLPFEDGTPFFGSPTKLFEYMAMGKAVVASRLGQIGEVIEDGESGMLYPPGSREDFMTKVSAVVESAALRESLGRGARSRVVRDFTWRRNVERTLDFLNRRLAGGGPG